MKNTNDVNKIGRFRPPAVPLITVDPYFNIWSFSDNLYDDFPRHWTGRRNALTGLLKIDGVWHRFMGKIQSDAEVYYKEPCTIPQESVKILPLKTEYIFTNEKIKLSVDFTSSLFLDDLYLMSRPFSYIDYKIESNDDKEHDIEIYVDISSEAAVDRSWQKVSFNKNKYKNSGISDISCGFTEQRVLSRSGDDHRIDWGTLHLTSPDSKMFCLDSPGKKAYVGGWKWNDITDWEPREVRNGYPSLVCVKEGKTGSSGFSGFVCIGYDDIKSIEYFGKQLDAYWKKDGEDFASASVRAVNEHDEIIRKADSFNTELQEKARKISDKYCDIISLAYRQAIAAHKLTFNPGDKDGEIQFFSKECFSNGCIATVDVTYPSIPLFLIYNSELVKGMLNPVFKYAASKQWEYDFAPHDVGQYPLANGQVYGYDAKLREMRLHDQMPVEECGNMILCTAAVCEKTDSVEYAEKNAVLLGKWADYLLKCGWDPANQLCTDDFAGHLARNCNLSIKGILGIAAWGRLLQKMGRKDEAQNYLTNAKQMAAEWKKAAFDKQNVSHYRLAFDKEKSWSIKYNLIWDKLLGLNIFDKDIAETEINYYKTKINAYGLPLDVRSDYTKSDWQMWSTVLTNDSDYSNQIIDAMWDMLCETSDRVPFSDWYYTSEPKQVGFQNRTVQGGLFINLLEF